MRKKSSIASSLLFSMLISTTLLIRPAFATCSDAQKSPEQELRTNIDLGGSMFLANGSSGIIQVRDRDLNPCGTGSAEDYDIYSLATSIIHSANLMKWVEVGWVEYVPANQSGKRWKIFWETEDQGDLNDGTVLAVPNVSYYSRFWVRKRTGSPSYQWFEYVDTDLSGSADWSHQLTHTTFANGYATGETERTGHCATGAADYHYDLEWLGSDLATWHNWQDNKDEVSLEPEISNWETRRLSASSYDVYKVYNC